MPSRMLPKHDTESLASQTIALKTWSCAVSVIIVATCWSKTKNNFMTPGPCLWHDLVWHHVTPGPMFTHSEHCGWQKNDHMEERRAEGSIKIMCLSSGLSRMDRIRNKDMGRTTHVRYFGDEAKEDWDGSAQRKRKGMCGWNERKKKEEKMMEQLS